MNEWISVEDNELPASKRVLIYWRPIDHEERPYHKEIIVGQLAHESTSKIWANGMYYDIKTHVTHWQTLPPPPRQG